MTPGEERLRFSDACSFQVTSPRLKSPDKGYMFRVKQRGVSIWKTAHGINRPTNPLTLVAKEGVAGLKDAEAKTSHKSSPLDALEDGVASNIAGRASGTSKLLGYDSATDSALKGSKGLGASKLDGRAIAAKVQASVKFSSVMASSLQGGDSDAQNLTSPIASMRNASPAKAQAPSKMVGGHSPTLENIGENSAPTTTRLPAIK